MATTSMNGRNKKKNGDNWGYCNTCGKFGSHQLCEICHVASYCSVDCQRRGWKHFGHRHNCKELQCQVDETRTNTMKPIILELMEMETRWLLSLTDEEKKIVVGDVDGNPAFKYHDNSSMKTSLVRRFRYRNYINSSEIALVLLRVNPCAVLSYPNDKSNYPGLYSASVLLPWYRKHLRTLLSEGISIQWARSVVDEFVRGPLVKDLRNPMLVAVNDCFESLHTGGSSRVTLSHNEAVSLMLSDKLHATFTAFFDPSVVCPIFDPLGRQYDLMARQSLVTYSFVKSDSSNEFNWPGNKSRDEEGTSQLRNRRRLRVDGTSNICTVAPCFRRVAYPEFASFVGEHFALCRDAMNKIGFDICLDIADALHNEEWSYEQIFDLLLAAARYSISRLTEWLKSGQVISTSRFRPNHFKSFKSFMKTLEVQEPEEYVPEGHDYRRLVNYYVPHIKCTDK